MPPQSSALQLEGLPVCVESSSHFRCSYRVSGAAAGMSGGAAMGGVLGNLIGGAIEANENRIIDSKLVAMQTTESTNWVPDEVPCQISNERLKLTFGL